MMNEQDDSMITSGSDIMPSEDGHICTDSDTCTVDQSQEHLMNNAPVEVLAVAQPAEKSPKNTRKAVLLALGALIVLVVGSSAFVYTHASTDKTVQTLTTRLPFPALMVGRSVVTYKQYYEEQDSLKKYFTSAAAQGVPAPSEDQQKMLIEQALVNKAVVRTLASNYGITLDHSKTEVFYQNFLKQNAGESPEVVEKQLMETFGWTASEFKKRVVEPIVLSTQVEEFIAKNEFFQKPGRDEIQSAHARVTTGGEDFETVGTEVHERVRLNMKSDLGFIKKSTLPESWGSKVVDLENGKVTDVIELPQGYAFFKVTERIKSQDKAVKKVDPKAPVDEQLHLYTITVQKKTLEQVTQEYLEHISVKTLIKT